MPGGRPPKSTELKVLQGNAGKRTPKPKKKAATPTPVDDGMEAPAYLHPFAREEWTRLLPELRRLGHITIVDVSQLAAYCQAYARWRQAAAAVDEQPTVGMAIAMGLVKMEKEAAAQMKQLATEFGFTPASRSRVAGVGKVEDEEDPLREFEVHHGGKQQR